MLFDSTVDRLVLKTKYDTLKKGVGYLSSWSTGKIIWRYCMKGIFILFIFLIIGCASYSKTMDAEIMQAANKLGVPYEALKQFIDSYKAQSVSSGIISVPIGVLVEEYNTNAVMADSLYKGKTIKTAGRIAKEISQDSSGQYFVILTNFSDDVMVYFKSSEITKLANLPPGTSTMQIIGICDGSSINLNNNSRLSVTIKDAVLEDF